MSKALHRLRDIFDDPLFERRDGVMQPTEVALKLGKPVRRALNEIQSALAPRDFDPGKARGVITIGSLDFYDIVLLPAVLGRITREAPGLEVVVLRSDRLRVHKQFANNELDFSLMPISDGVTELHSEPIFAETPVTLLRRGHPLAGNMTLEAFAGAGHVTVAVEGQGASWIDVALAARGLQRRIVLTLPSFAGAPFVIGTTDLISTLPARLVARLGEPADVVMEPPPLPTRTLTIHLAWHPRSSASPLHTWLRSTIRSVAAAI